MLVPMSCIGFGRYGAKWAAPWRLSERIPRRCSAIFAASSNLLFATSPHCCPVDGEACSGKGWFGRSLRAEMGGVDLNLIGRYSEFFRGVAREHRQNAFRPTHGFSALEHLYADCCALRWRRSGANAVLCRAIPSDGVRATDLPREPARYRGLPVG